MPRRLTALLVLATLILVSVSCFSWRMKDVRTLTEPLPENTEILSVAKSSGDTVLFSKSNPGRLRGYTIVGVARNAESQRLELTGPFNIMKDANGRVYEVKDGKGRVHSVAQILSQGDGRMTVLASPWTPVSIPLAEVHKVEVKKSNALRNAALASGGLVALVLLPFLLPSIF